MRSRKGYENVRNAKLRVANNKALCYNEDVDVEVML